ncbi:conserved hypothetical protein [Culex quinquefasciatus]|uniref:Uncharacterized protein n=1 Tax=Culex quinquefasciatus TaxID=7176 RepID=B0W260_CULQU|nr:conserved hypothetical protein [Culex quinquefasciatus]|eukprot:XP_001842823.1 conserved hypothetical protein [Culex quinquefasciatus]
MFIGDGAKLVWDASALAKEKSPLHTCVVVGSAGVCNAAGFLTATARASNTRAWFSELVSSSSMPGSSWACGNGCGRIVRVVEVRPAGTASSTVLPSSPAFASLVEVLTFLVPLFPIFFRKS